MSGGLNRLSLPTEYQHSTIATRDTGVLFRTALSHPSIPRSPLKIDTDDYTDFEERFWGFVEIPDDDPREQCWEWQAELRNGYGRVWVTHETRDYRRHTAHRVAYEISIGDPPDDADVIHHTCDNPSCCNPSHLYPTTISENSRFAWEAGQLKLPPEETRTEEEDHNIRLMNMLSSLPDRDSE